MQLQRPDTAPDDLGPHDPERLAGYRAVAAVYVVAAGAAAVALHRRRADGATPPATQWSDIALVGLSTYKLSRLLTKQTVTSPLRAPFAEFVDHGGPGEVNVRPVGRGWRRSVGELLSCPFCLDVWIASASTAALRFDPGPARMVLSAFAAVGAADLLQFVHVSLEHQAER
ncbi:DUF1360 domain-containing protein [Dermatobacter hominis]|uniref:DUF1360 domain-containing protein n=1 Tax=Dermatobacter hominis TaxID=2884263 RepID=UPI001D1026A8|nr:DUF1360 domain-containing protein [Dermatobacter hominis]UDY37528.1 DUF1360 domain-containing protein [Dermatobacter hominis]